MILTVAILVPFLVAFGMARIMWEHRQSKPMTLPRGVTIGVLLGGLFWVLPNDWLTGGSAAGPRCDRGLRLLGVLLPGVSRAVSRLQIISSSI